MKPVSSLGLVLATGLALGLTPLAYASGTTAGQSISNTASVDFEVGGINQPDVPSNTTTFVVDRKINVVVTNNNGGATNVIPNSTAQWIEFTVQNTSNATLDYSLSAANLAGDDFNASSLGAYVEDGTTPGYQPLEDTATYIDEIVADDIRTVYVVGNIPSGVTNTQDANITLTATARQDTVALTGVYAPSVGSLGALAVETNTGTADDPTFIDTVFADAAGSATGDVAYDGKHSASGQYNVSTATIAVTKSSSVVTDPFNCTTAGNPATCTTSPKAVPGAVIEYCLDVNNTGATAADAIVLTDAIPTNTTFISASIRSVAAGTGSACTVGTGTSEDDNDTGADESDAAGGDYNISAAGSVTVRTPTIGAASRFKATFRVTVD